MQFQRNDIGIDGVWPFVVGALAISLVWLFFGYTLEMLYLLAMLGVAYWVYRDAIHSGFEHSIAWTITVFVTGPIGLLVYLATAQLASDSIVRSADQL